MALKHIVGVGLLAAVIGPPAMAQDADDDTSETTHDQRVVEEVVVSAQRWRDQDKPETDPAESPRWQISDETREKMRGRIQFGYDPVLEEIYNTDNRIKVRGNMREPEPVTIIRARF